MMAQQRKGDGRRGEIGNGIPIKRRGWHRHHRGIGREILRPLHIADADRDLPATPRHPLQLDRLLAQQRQYLPGRRGHGEERAEAKQQLAERLGLRRGRRGVVERQEIAVLAAAAQQALRIMFAQDHERRLKSGPSSSIEEGSAPPCPSVTVTLTFTELAAPVPAANWAANSWSCAAAALRSAAALVRAEVPSEEPESEPEPDQGEKGELLFFDIRGSVGR